MLFFFFHHRLDFLVKVFCKTYKSEVIGLIDLKSSLKSSQMSCLDPQIDFPPRAARWGAPGALFSGHFILVDSHICARVQVLKKIYKSETIELIELKPSL